MTEDQRETWRKALIGRAAGRRRDRYRPRHPPIPASIIRVPSAGSIEPAPRRPHRSVLVPHPPGVYQVRHHNR
jgi:hypothetical protein